MSRRVLRSRVIDGTCSAKSGLCREVIGNVAFVSRLVRQGRVIVSTCWGRST